MVCNMVRCVAVVKPAPIGVIGLVGCLISLLPTARQEGAGMVTAASVCMPPMARVEGR